MLLLAHTYYNGLLIPKKFMWKNGKPNENLLPLTAFQLAILFLEIGALSLLMYYINRISLTKVIKTKNKQVAAWTRYIYVATCIIFTIILVYPNFE